MKRWSVLAVFLALAAPAWAKSPDPVPLKGPDGKAYGVVVTCNDCQASGKGCFEGAENGYLNGKPCGQCYLSEGDKKPITYPFDLHLMGKLTNSEGKPVKDRFVKLFLPNGWGHRTRTLESGDFHLMLGATGSRESKQPVVLNLGTMVDETGKADEFFALYMLPNNFVPCRAMGEPHKKMPR